MEEGRKKGDRLRTDTMHGNNNNSKKHCVFGQAYNRSGGGENLSILNSSGSSSTAGRVDVV